MTVCPALGIARAVANAMAAMRRESRGGQKAYLARARPRSCLLPRWRRRRHAGFQHMPQADGFGGQQHLGLHCSLAPPWTGTFYGMEQHCRSRLLHLFQHFSSLAQLGGDSGTPAPGAWTARHGACCKLWTRGRTSGAGQADHHPHHHTALIVRSWDAISPTLHRAHTPNLLAWLLVGAVPTLCGRTRARRCTASTPPPHLQPPNHLGVEPHRCTARGALRGRDEERMPPAKQQASRLRHPPTRGRAAGWTLTVQRLLRLPRFWLDLSGSPLGAQLFSTCLGRGHFAIRIVWAGQVQKATTNSLMNFPSATHHTLPACLALLHPTCPAHTAHRPAPPPQCANAALPRAATWFARAHLPRRTRTHSHALHRTLYLHYL